MHINDITFLTCQYEKSILTLHCIKSLRKQSGHAIPFVICDSSSNDKFDYDIPNITIIKNYGNANTSHSSDASTRHCSCIEYAISKINTKYVVLMDNDILFIKNPIPILKNFNNFDLIGDVVKCKFGNESQYKRLCPFFCGFNLQKTKESNIHYYRNGSIVYLKKDTRCSFYYDCIENGFNIYHINTSDYIIHLGHGSWKNQNIDDFLTKNKNLY